jgi:hypothetical protein
MSAAFVSWAHTIKEFPVRYQHATTLLHSLLQAAEGVSSLSKCLVLLYQAVQSFLSNDCAWSGKSLDETTQSPKKLHQITKTITDHYLQIALAGQTMQ